MNRMWESILLPIIKFENIKSIVEIGAEEGINTENILTYCLDNDAKLVSIDPEPIFDVIDFEERYKNYFTFFKELSLERLPLLDNYDCVLIDGDHNWYTVFHELKCIGEKFSQDNFPLVFLHDVSWPYGRRDLYYNPENIPPEYLNNYSKLGMHPDSEELLSEFGLNTSLFNANKENTPKNGVLTAVEDFLQESSLNLDFHIVPIFFGLGIIHKKDEGLYDFIEKILYSNDVLTLVDLFYIRNDLYKSKELIKKDKFNEELSNVNSQKEVEINQLNRNVMELRKDLSNKISELEILKKNIQKNPSYLLLSGDGSLDNESNVGEIIDSLNSTNNYLRKSNENYIDEINNLKNEIIHLNRSIELFDEKNKILTDSLEQKQSEIANLNLKLEGYNEKLTNYEVDLFKNNHALNQMNIKYDSLSELNEYLANVNNKQSIELTKLKEENDSLNNIVDDLSSHSSDLEKEVNIHLSNIDSLNENLWESNEKLKEYKVKSSEKSFDLVQANAKLKLFSKQKNLLVKNNFELSDKVLSLTEDADNFKDVISDLKETTKFNQDKLNVLNEAYQNTVHLKYNLEQENAYLKNLNRNLQLKLDELRGK